MADQGWTFAAGPGVIPRPDQSRAAIHQIYMARRIRLYWPRHGPLLWDKATGTIVNNELADIIRMLNAPSTASARPPATIIRSRSRAEIDALNARDLRRSTTASTRPASPRT